MGDSQQRVSESPTGSVDVYYDTASNFHPFECDGRGKCVHCDRAETERHDPATCALCDPEYS